MALQSYSLAVGNLEDVDGKNYSVNTPVYVTNSAGVAQQLYRDIGGTVPIAQDGIDNQTDSNGEFTFFVEEGNWIVSAGGDKKTIYVVGPDYFNNQIEAVSDSIIEKTNGVGVTPVIGDFNTGFTFTDINQAGTYNNGGTVEYYIFVGGESNLPHSVAPSTNPVGDSNYQQVSFNDHNATANRGAVGAHDLIYIRALNMPEAISENAPIGTRYLIENVRYDVVSITDSGGFYAPLNALKKFKVDLTQPVIPASIINIITVGSGGNFSTITDALDLCRRIRTDSSQSSVSISLLSGFVLEEQVIISGVDLSYVVVSSVDTTVSVSQNVWTMPIQEGGYTPAISARFGAVSPVFNVVFDAGEDASSDDNKAGFVARGFGKILSSGGAGPGEHLGFINLNGRGLYCFQNGEAQANYSELNNNYVGHRCSNNSRSQIRWSNLRNCTSFSIMCDSSYINASQANGDDSANFAISTNCGDLMLKNAFGRRTTSNSVQVVDGGSIVLTDTDLSGGATALIATGGRLSGNRLIHNNTTGDAIDARTGATVSIPSANLSGSGVGIRARFGSRVSAPSVDVSSCGSGVISDGSTVECGGVNASGCTTGLFTTNEGEIKAGESANVSGATGTGMSASSGMISSIDIDAKNCTRALQASGGGTIKAINADESGRTSKSRVLSGGVIHATGMNGNSGAITASDFDGITAFNEYGTGGVVYKTT